MAIHYYNPQWGASRPIRGILFDMDGLVLDSEALYTRFWREAANALGFPMTAPQSLGMRSLGKALGCYDYEIPDAYQHYPRYNF